jgi:CO dehydrogenase maturation factor
MLGHLVDRPELLTILDMEASIEHMSRGTPRHTDILLIVAEPYYRSLETVGRMVPLAQELGIKQVCVVANKVRGPRDEEAIRRYCAERELEILAVLPFDEDVLEAEQSGIPILDQDPDSAYVQEVEQLRERLPVEPVKKVHESKLAR